MVLVFVLFYNKLKMIIPSNKECNACSYFTGIQVRNTYKNKYNIIHFKEKIIEIPFNLFNI